MVTPSPSGTKKATRVRCGGPCRPICDPTEQTRGRASLEYSVAASHSSVWDRNLDKSRLFLVDGVSSEYNLNRGMRRTGQRPSVQVPVHIEKKRARDKRQNGRWL